MSDVISTATNPPPTPNHLDKLLFAVTTGLHCALKASLPPLDLQVLSMQHETMVLHPLAPPSTATTNNTSSTSSSGSRRPASLEPTQDLEVIKAILLRESYLTRLRNVHDRAYDKANKALKAIPDPTKISKKASPPHVKNVSTNDTEVFLTLPADMIDLLELIRTSTVEVVEAIGRWKLSRLDPNAEYIWNGENYLLRIPKNLSYLQSFTPLTSWLKLDMSKNPFIVRHPMLGDGDYDVIQEEQTSDMHVGANEPSFVALEKPKFTPLRPEPSPYLTPIINDIDMIPTHTKGKAVSHRVLSNSTSSPWRKKDSKYKPSEITPASIINSSDLERVRKAEAIILREQDLYGFHDERKGMGTTTRSLHATVKIWPWFSSNGILSTRRRLRPQAPEPPSSPREADVEDVEYVGGRVPVRKRHPTAYIPMDAPDNPPALKRAKKVGCMITDITAAGTTGRIKPLARPNRFARMETEMHHLRVEIGENNVAFRELQHEVDSVQSEAFIDRYDRDVREEAITSEEDPPPPEVFEGGLSVAQYTAKLRREMDRLYTKMENIWLVTRRRQQELDFKLQCKGYLEQVKKSGRDNEEAARLTRGRAQLRDGEILPEDEKVRRTNKSIW